MSNIGEIIKKLRLEKDMSMDEMANQLKKFDVNPSKSMISRWENGKAEPTMSYVRVLSNFFNVSLDYLLGFTDDNSASTKANQKFKSDEFPFYSEFNVDNIISIPIVGSVQAGQPILAQDNIEGALPVLKSTINTNKEYFFLKVQGDSMNLEFKEGTMLLIEKTPCIENGKIGVVLIDGMDATVKKIIQNDNMITLIPMSNNPEHIPKMYDVVKDEIQIIGVVDQAIKKYN